MIERRRQAENSLGGLDKDAHLVMVIGALDRDAMQT
jgi:hypothetical protein